LAAEARYSFNTLTHHGSSNERVPLGKDKRFPELLGVRAVRCVDGRASDVGSRDGAAGREAIHRSNDVPGKMVPTHCDRDDLEAGLARPAVYRSIRTCGLTAAYPAGMQCLQPAPMMGGSALHGCRRCLWRCTRVRVAWRTNPPGRARTSNEQARLKCGVTYACPRNRDRPQT